MCGKPFRTGHEPAFESSAIETGDNIDPSSNREESFVEASTQDIAEGVRLTDEVSPTFQTTQESLPLPVCTAVLGELYVRHVTFSEASSTLSTCSPTPASTRDLQPTKQQQSTHALVSQSPRSTAVMPRSVSTCTMATTATQVSQLPTQSLPVEGVPDIPVDHKTLSSETRSSQADLSITTVSISERSQLTLLTRMDSRPHMTVSSPSSSSVLTTVDQPLPLPAVTQGDRALPAVSRSITWTQSATQSSSDEPESKLSPGTTIDPLKAGEAFKKHRHDLLIAVTDPLVLANHLYTRDIISREILSRVQALGLTTSDKNVILFDAIESRLRTHPSDFCTLLSVLSSPDSHLRAFAEKIRNSYLACKCQHTCTRRIYCLEWLS